MSCERVARTVTEEDFTGASFPICEKLPDGRNRITVSPTAYVYLEGSRIEGNEELWGRAAEAIGAEMELKFFSPPPKRKDDKITVFRSLLTITTEDENLVGFWRKVRELRVTRRWDTKKGRLVLPEA